MSASEALAKLRAAGFGPEIAELERDRDRARLIRAELVEARRIWPASRDRAYVVAELRERRLAWRRRVAGLLDQ